MAIDTSSMLARLSPIAPININPAGGGGGMARQQLALARARFEEEKRVNRENAELRRLSEANEMARQQLIGEQQRAKAEAEAKAERMKLKQAGALEFSKLAGSGDIEGARALVPYLASVGQGVELLGEEGGMPSFRMFDLDDQGNEFQAPEQGIGYPTDESGSLDVPAGIPSTEEAFGRALGASQHFAETGMPARGPDEPDYTGGVPRNVIDTGAMASATAARLAPMLGNLIQAYPDASGPDPDAYRRSAESTARGVLGSGMPALKALDQFKSLRGGADAILQAQIAADAQQGRFEQQQEMRGKALDQRLIAQGEDKARKSFADSGVKSSLDIIRISEQIEQLLTNDDPLDDIQTATLITELSRTKGSQSDKDVARALGMDAASTIDQIIAFIKKKAVGGFSRTQRNSLIGFAKSARDTEKKVATDWLSNVDSAVSGPDMDRNVAVGWERYRDAVVPKWLRDEYGATRDKKRAETDSGFDTELDAVSRASGLDPDKVRSVISPESGGSAQAVNPQSGASGLIQFLPKVAESLGSSIEEIRKMTAEEQLPLVMKYLSDRGITKDSSQDDYYMAVAAPAFIGKPDSAVVYKKGSKEWEQNPAWRPADGGDITVGSIKAYGAKGATKKSKPPATSSADADALDILNRSGY